MYQICKCVTHMHLYMQYLPSSGLGCPLFMHFQSAKNTEYYCSICLVVHESPVSPIILDRSMAISHTLQVQLVLQEVDLIDSYNRSLIATEHSQHHHNLIKVSKHRTAHPLQLSAACPLHVCLLSFAKDDMSEPNSAVLKEYWKNYFGMEFCRYWM